MSNLGNQSGKQTADYAIQRYRDIYMVLTSIPITQLTPVMLSDSLNRFDLEIIGLLNDVSFIPSNHSDNQSSDPEADRIAGAHTLYQYIVDHQLLHPDQAIIRPSFLNWYIRACNSVVNSTSEQPIPPQHSPPIDLISPPATQLINLSDNQSTSQFINKPPQLNASDMKRLSALDTKLLQDYMVTRDQMIKLQLDNQPADPESDQSVIQSINKLRSDFLRMFSLDQLIKVMIVHDMPWADRSVEDIGASIRNYMSGDSLIEVPNSLLNDRSSDDDDVVFDDERTTIAAIHQSSNQSSPSGSINQHTSTSQSINSTALDTDEESETSSYFSEPETDIKQPNKKPVIQPSTPKPSSNRSDNPPITPITQPSNRSNPSTGQKRRHAELAWTDAVMSIDKGIDRSVHQHEQSSSRLHKPLPVATFVNQSSSLSGTPKSNPTPKESPKHINHSINQSVNQAHQNNIAFEQAFNQFITQPSTQSTNSTKHISNPAIYRPSNKPNSNHPTTHHQFNSRNGTSVVQATYQPLNASYQLSTNPSSIQTHPPSYQQSYGPSYHQSYNQSSNPQSYSTLYPPGGSAPQYSVSRSINQSTIESLRQSKNRSSPMGQSVRQTGHQPIDQPLSAVLADLLCIYLTPRDSHAVFQLNRRTRAIQIDLLYSINQQNAMKMSVNQPINQPINRSMNQSMNQQSAYHRQPVYQSNNQSNNQSTQHSSRQPYAQAIVYQSGQQPVNQATSQSQSRQRAMPVQYVQPYNTPHR